MWILFFSFIPFLNVISWMIAASRTNHKQYAINAIAYSFFYATCIALKKLTAINETIPAIMITLIWFGGLAHILIARRGINTRIKYYNLSKTAQRNNSVPLNRTTPIPTPTSPTTRSLRPIAATSPIVPVDLNHADEATLAGLPHFGPLLAKKAIAFREVERYYLSLDDFAQALRLEPDIVQKIKPHVVVNFTENDDSKREKAGRIVDY